MGHEFEEIKRAVTAEDAARYYGLQINLRTHRAKCPFHGGEHENLSFHGSGFRCFVCGTSGTSIDFAMKYLGVPSAMQAARRLDRDFNLDLFDKRPVIQPPLHQARALKTGQLEKAFCGWCGRVYTEWRDAALEAAFALNGRHYWPMSQRERRRIRDKMHSFGRKYALIRRFLQDVDAGFIEPVHNITVSGLFLGGGEFPVCTEKDLQRLYRLFAEDRKAAAGYCQEWAGVKKITPAMREDITRVREVFALDN